MSIAQKALWIIERNSSRDLTLNGVAEACGVSRSHLAHAFGAATGQSAMRYLRGRRLSEAAHVLAAGAPDILAVALDAGYGSHEAFTRAFRDQFAVTPETVRDRKSVHGLAVVAPIETPRAPLARPAPPELVPSGKILVVGLAEQMTFETTHRIPAQWQRFVPYMEAIPAKLPRMPVGVTNALDDAGAYEYICALEVSRFGDTPAGLKQLTIPARTYAVFQHRGHVSAINDTYLAIWNEVLPEMGLTALDAPAIERHNPAFDPGTGEGGVEIWIPVAA